MVGQLEDSYQLIGEEAVSIAGSGSALLVYAEVDDGVVSVNVFFPGKPSHLIFKHGSQGLLDLVHDFCEAWGKERPTWAAMEFYVSEEEELDLFLVVPANIDADSGQHLRRDLAVRKRFGEVRIDHSDPEP